MNKTKTGILAITVMSLTAAASSVLAQSATSRYPITPEQRSTADQVAQAGVPLSELAPNAPERYTVKRGDTLWDLSSMYLTSPWRWPELWGMNKEQIRNPHLIYPGPGARAGQGSTAAPTCRSRATADRASESWSRGSATWTRSALPSRASRTA
jgi:hypothetical protein